MKANFLFPNKFKKIGWFLLIPSTIIGLVTLAYEFEPSFLDLNVLVIFVEDFFTDKKLFGIINNNILNEILGILLIISSLFVAFSKEKIEDEFISKIRLESLVWAVYFNCGILFFSFVFVFNFSFLWVMILNMFTVLFFFIIRFNWQIFKLKKSDDYEE